MPPLKKTDSKNGDIRGFFKQFAQPRIPKSHIPVQDEGDEIVVSMSSPKRSGSPRQTSRVRKPSRSPRGSKNGKSSSQSSQSSSALSSLGSTPTRQQSTPRTTPKARVVVRQMEKRKQSLSGHSSPSGSQRRVLAAVEIPFPKPKSPVNPPQEASPRPKSPVIALTESSTRPVTASFSSISTLSSVPHSTQSSSRRVIKNGIQAITNSDSGSAESSDDDLADASTFMPPPRKKIKLTPSPPAGKDREHAIEVPDTVKPIRRPIARDKRSTGSASAPARDASPPPRTDYKDSLAKLLAQRLKEEKAEKKLKEMEERFAEGEKARDEARRKDREAMSGVKLAAADDSDEGERMMLAMQRTGALDEDEKFYYFAGIVSKCKDEPFPSEACAGLGGWMEKMKDERWRTHACLSGFLAECAAKEEMPSPIRKWLCNQIMHENSEDLCEAYTVVLETCRLTNLEDSDNDEMHDEEANPGCYLSDFYSSLDSSIERAKPVLPFRLPNVLRIIRRFNVDFVDPWTDVTAASFTHLMLANLDANVQSNGSLKVAIEDSMDYIVRQWRQETWSFGYNVGRWMDLIDYECWPIQTRCRAIAAMPDLSEQSGELKRYLALHVLHEKIDYVNRRPDSVLYDGNLLLERLKTMPEFSISDTTDYGLLSHLVQLLEIGISSGFPTQTPQLAKETTLHSTKQSDSSEKSFNAQIDAFVSQLNLMSSRIRDAGTTHLRRTQAKSAIERLSKRLEYGVRTKPKPRKGVFSSETLSTEGERDFLKGFLKLGEKKMDGSEVVNVIDEPVLGADEEDGDGR